MTSPRANVKADPLTFESVARSHMTATLDRQQAGLRAWAEALAGDVQSKMEDEPLLTLAETGKEVRKHPTWLHKLEIQKHAGERLGGRYMYRKSRVMTYLQSDECQDRIHELHEQRKSREQIQKVRAA